MYNTCTLNKTLCCDTNEFWYKHFYCLLINAVHYSTSCDVLEDKHRSKIYRGASLDGFIAEEKTILNGFLSHINHVKTVPSPKDKRTVAEAYYAGKYAI